MRYYGKIHSKLPIFRVKSVTIYTGQKKIYTDISVATVTNIRYGHYYWPLESWYICTAPKNASLKLVWLSKFYVLKITKQVPDTLRLKRKAESVKWFSIVKVVSAHCISYCLCHRNHKSKIGRTFFGRYVVMFNVWWCGCCSTCCPTRTCWCFMLDVL